MSPVLEFALAAAGALILTSPLIARRFLERPKPAPQPQAPRSVRSEVRFVRPNPGSVEGLEIRYQDNALVRSAQVGAMNSEHKELLLTMDGVRWHALPNAQKQEVLAAARSTWAAKICAGGPDIAYLIVKTECGDVVGRADPSRVTVL